MRVVNRDDMDTYGTDNSDIIIEASGPTVPDGYLTVPEAAERTGLSQRAIRRALTEGRLTGVQMIGRWMVPVDSLDDYARVARRHLANRAAAPAEQHGAPPELMELVNALESVVDRAVAAEVRAAEVEIKLRQIEASTSAVEIERDQLRERVVDLEAQLAARRKSWWPWSRDRGSAAA